MALLQDDELADPPTSEELEEVNLAAEVPYLDPNAKYFRNTREGWHCENFHMMSRTVEGRIRHNYLKRSFEPCTEEKAARLASEYEALKTALGDVVPDAAFIHTQITPNPDDEPGVLVITEPVDIAADIFDLDREELVAMLRDNETLREEIATLADAVEQWEEEGRLLDLSGEENLVLSAKQNARYVDSFEVFLDPEDEDQQSYVQASRARAEYLRSVLAESQL